MKWSSIKMSEWKRVPFQYGIAVILFFMASAEIFAIENLKVIESTDRGVTILYEPTIDVIDTVVIKNDKYIRINSHRTLLTSDPGEPLVPVKIVNIGIPLKAEVNANILSTDFRKIDGKLLPAPEIDREGNYFYEANSEIYNSSKFFPQQILKLGEPFFVRNQRTIPVEINVLQFLPGNNSINMLDKILIRIDFIGDTSPSSTIRNINDDEFYQGLIENYSFSKNWLKARPQKLHRSRTTFEGEKWYKITVKDEGIYKISGSDLAEKGIDISSIDPKTLRLYNNGGRELPRDMKIARPDSLIENAIRVIGEDDGSFSSSDFFLFYGVPVNFWQRLDDKSNFYSHYINHYTKENVYWLTWGDGKTGKRMEIKPVATNQALDANLSFWGRYYDEDEINNFLQSGLDWFGRLMAGNQDQGYSLYLPEASNMDNNVYFRIKCLGMTSGTHRFNLFFNNVQFGSFSFNGHRVHSFEKTVTLQLAESGYNNLKIQYNGDSQESQAYLDWFEVQYRKQYVAENDFLWFSQLEDGEQKYRISNFSNDQIDVYDVTNRTQMKLITNTEIASGAVTFVDDETGFPRHQYFAVSAEAYRTPESIEQVTFTNLRVTNRGADFIIITHENFYQAVLPLKQHREQRDNLQTEIVKISDIYNEFSWGLVDVTAIRDFIKFVYENWNPSPKYVLLCGDGDYDYKNIKADADMNWLPPYQTTELSENINRTSDDWFVTVSGYDSSPDLAIGRFPVQTAEETENVVEKILNYENTPFWSEGQSLFLDDWRNVVVMVGDDEFSGGGVDNETIHTRDAEYIIEKYIPNSFVKEKIYLFEYPSEKDPSTSGVMKPAATEALISRINKGILILNYVGHGAPPLWADERVLKESRDFERIQNENKLPFWLAATCDFGRFDDPLEQGFAEKLFAAKGRGGIAFLTSARLAYASDNTALNREFYTQLLKSNEKPTERIGVALMKAKIRNYSSTNDQKYHIYGDPTMRLAAPHYQAKIVSLEPDTLKALSEINVTGQVLNVNDFEGKALLRVVDSRKSKTYTTAKQSSIHYVIPGNTIFRGAVSVNQGTFIGKFIVPKDISYGGNLGRVSIYFANEQMHGIGYRDSLTVGGTSYLSDTEGPFIKIGFQGQNFADGNLVGNKSVLEIEVADSVSGINIVGDIGHNITMVIDGNENDKITLTDYFNYYEGNYKAGKVVYDFSTYKSSTTNQADDNITEENLGLPEGNHEITIKAWDNFNNSSLATAYFTVLSEDVLEIKNVLNYPNPFTTNTTFTFALSLPCEFKIKIYTLRGTLVQTLEDLSGVSGLNQVFWDGLDREGDVLANGVYLYKIFAKSTAEEKTLKDEAVGKLVLAR
jgi:hypothetical protein